MLDWLKDEGIALCVIVVGSAMLLFVGLVGDFFGGIGDKIFKKKD